MPASLSAALGLALLASPPGPVELSLAGGETQVRTSEATAHGLPIRGAYEVWATTPAGDRRELATRPATAPTITPDQRQVSAADAGELARAKLGWSPSTTELVYVNHLGEAVLAWELRSPLRLDPGAPPALDQIWISAEHGTILARRPLAFHSGVTVFPENPSTTPIPIERELLGVDVDLADQPLSGALIEVAGCADAPVEGEAPPPAWWAANLCAPYARARSDALGDYHHVPLPQIGTIADNEAFDDAYAEVAAYYYVEQFFAGMAERGLTSTRCERFTVLTNRYNLTEDGERVPQGGASYIDVCDPEVTPTLLVGQGRYADYAYDADILAHELGHSVIQHLTPAGLVDRKYDPIGILSESGAIHEGVADYLAMALAEDPEVGEYIGRFSVDLSTPYVRTGLNDKTCPRDLAGQWHSDGQIVSGGLWAARVRVGPIVDEIVLQALPRLGPDATLEDFGQACLATAQEFRAAGELDALGFELLQRTLQGRGLLECVHVIDDVGLATRGKRMALIAKDESLAPFAPGPLQLRYEVPAGETEVTVFATMSMTSGEGPPAATVLLRFGDEPIAFAYALVDGVTQVSGEWDVEVEAESLNDQDYIARIPVEPGDVVHVALANRAAGGVSASNFFVVASDAAPGAEELERGCACAIGEGSAGGLGVALLGLLVWLGLRRGSEHGQFASVLSCPSRDDAGHEHHR